MREAEGRGEEVKVDVGVMHSCPYLPMRFFNL